MVQHTELLSTLAEVSIVFAGFTGVVGMLGLRTDDPGYQGQRFQIGAMIGYSLIAALFSIVPLILSAVGLSDAAAWRLSSVGLLAAMLGWTALGISRSRNLKRSGYRPVRMIQVIMRTTTAFILLILLANAVGFLGLHAGGAYVACVFIPLVYAAVFFLRAFLGVIMQD
jgi:hypothetical protein